MGLPNRLYLRIYFAMLAALVIAALIIGAVWKHTFEGNFLRGQFAGLAADIATELLPAGDAGGEPLQQALQKWHRRSHASLALYDASRRLIAAAGPAVPPLPPQLNDSGWLPPREGPPAIALKLADGRWLVARQDHRVLRRPMGFMLTLALIALMMGILAYPVARRLTRRLERLQASVERLGSGDLSARAPVQGRDEVAALARSFNRSAERIESLVQAQKTLLANASHELRSPLARLRMTAETLSANADPAQRAHLRQDIAELDQLIEEILLASRLEAGGAAAAPAREEVDLTGLLAEECARTGAELRDTMESAEEQPSTAAAHAGARQRSPSRSPAPAASPAEPSSPSSMSASPMLLLGDPVLLRRMLRNLLENARRHGGGSPVTATLTSTAGGDMQVRVCDRGPGIPESERERIFEPFHRLKGMREGEGGAGLGLSLVRRIAELHGGSVRCSAREGGGACFEVRLPVP